MSENVFSIDWKGRKERLGLDVIKEILQNNQMPGATILHTSLIDIIVYYGISLKSFDTVVEDMFDPTGSAAMIRIGPAIVGGAF